MARLGCLFFIIIVLVVGYDQWRIAQLQEEVRAISGKVHVSPGTKKSGSPSDLLTSLAEAQKHTKAAKELIAKKKLPQAQVELDKALAKLKTANGVSQDIVGDVAQVLGKARDKTVRVFQKAWNDIAEEAKPKKKDVEPEGKK